MTRLSSPTGSMQMSCAERVSPAGRRASPVCVERFRLLQNTGEGHTQGEPNEWRLTSQGSQVTQPIRAHAHNNRRVA
jgi:hypothetical protein